MPQHFVAPPQWEWYIVWYFFLGGIAGGAYVIGTLLRLFGSARDEGAARIAFLISFPTMVICPILLTLDLGHPVRFWHMLIDSRTFALNFKYWSPMSVGAWMLFIFGAFATVSFVEAATLRGSLRHPLAQRITGLLSGGFGRLFMVVGALFGLFITGYTGVLLSVSNQPIWSDTWTLGGLFLASGLSVAVASIALVSRMSRETADSEVKLIRADRVFIVLELLLIAALFVTLGAMGGKLLFGRYLILWLLVLAGTIVPLVLQFRSSMGRPAFTVLASFLILLGGLALRMVVVFAAQA
jgi:formate-dependent nitrite reductase membrane component NrfD